MLAWIHQSCPGETESIHHLLQHVDKVDRRALETRIMTGATEGVRGDHDDVIMILLSRYADLSRAEWSRSWSVRAAPSHSTG